MKTKFRYYFILSFVLALTFPKANGQTLLQFWDFNQTRPTLGTGGDSLGTLYSYANSDATDSAVNTWPLTADYTASGLTKGHIVYHRPQNLYSSLGRDSILDNDSGAGSAIFDYSSVNYSYFTTSDSGFVGGNMCIRARNPSDSSTFTLFIPTSGYKNIMLQYALSASSTKGAMYNIFSYTTDGTTWKNLTTAMDTFTLGGGVVTPDTLVAINATTSSSLWEPVQLDFRSDSTVNNNPNFALRFLITGGNSIGSSGNDRYDNFAVWGSSPSGINELPAQAAGYNVYPNPVNDFVEITSAYYTGDKVISVYDIVGQMISVTENNNLSTSINMTSLNSGVYFVEIREVSTGNKYTVKIVKE